MSADWFRLIRFVAVETAQIHIGQPVDDALDVGLAAYEKQSIKAFEISGGSALNSDARVTERLLTVAELLSPLSRDEIKIVRCLGINYANHAAETNIPKPNAPILFIKPASVIIPPTAPITIPLAAQPPEKHVPDFEVELSVVIGPRPAKNVTKEDALNYVLGYTLGNDVSFRFHQMNVSQWTFSKGFDDTNPLGPCIIRPSTLPSGNPQNIPLTCSLNGEVMQNGSTADMIFGVAETIAHLSSGTTLEPGTIILTGTPDGVGFTRKPPVFMKHGDTLISWAGAGIGSLVNDVVEEGKVVDSSKL